MGSSSRGARWHRHRIPAPLAGVIATIGGRTGRPVTIAPNARGHVAPRVVDALERRGWHVHRIGSAAYVHADTTHLIFGVWPKRSPRPGWAARLGAASAGYRRRLERVALEQRWRRQLRDQRTGQFGRVMPWPRWPTPALYSWDPAGLSVADQIEALERESRWRAGLAGPLAESELRLLDGNR